MVSTRTFKNGAAPTLAARGRALAAGFGVNSSTVLQDENKLTDAYTNAYMIAAGDHGIFWL
jgi:hypothetical protein